MTSGKREMKKEDQNNIMKKLMTITEVAEIVQVTPRTIMRWEAKKKVKKARRDWRGWRVYEEEDIQELVDFRNTFRYE